MSGGDSKAATDLKADLIICRCEEVSQKEIIEVIDEGAISLAEIKWRTRTGMGLCQGKTCARLVAQLLSDSTKLPLSGLAPFTHRPPVRPMPLGVLAELLEGEI